MQRLAYFQFSRKKAFMGFFCLFFFTLILPFMIILISEEEPGLFTAPHSFLHFICIGRMEHAQSTFQCQVPLIKSPVTSELLCQPHISITSLPQ